MQLFVQLDLKTIPAELKGKFGSGLLQFFYCTGNDGSRRLSLGFSYLYRFVCPERLMVSLLVGSASIRAFTQSGQNAKPASRELRETQSTMHRPVLTYPVAPLVS
jgi:hypothetical protein